MRELISSGSFNKKLGEFLSNHPELQIKTKRTLELLAKDVFYPLLKTHKLSGTLKIFYSANINYQYRIVFLFDKESVILVNIGSHDEVY